MKVCFDRCVLNPELINLILSLIISVVCFLDLNLKALSICSKNQLEKAKRILSGLVEDGRLPRSVLERSLVRYGQLLCVEVDDTAAESYFARLRREDYTFGMQGMIRDDEMKGAGNSISFKYRDYDFDCLFASSCVLYQSGAIRFRYKQRPETDGNENCNR